jgi:hypothetical protein
MVIDNIIFLLVVLALLVGLIFYFKRAPKKNFIRVIVLFLIMFAAYLLSVVLFNPYSVDVTSFAGFSSAFFSFLGWLVDSISSLWDTGVQATGAVIEQVNKTR